MPIDPIGGAFQAPAAAATNPSTGDPAAGFGEMLSRAVENVDKTTGEANAAIGRMLDGSGDVHDAMIAMQRADLMLQLTVQVRNKLVQAYQDIMRMPV